MKTLILILFVALSTAFSAKAQPPAADFDINLLMQPPAVALNNMGTLQVSTCNNGNLDIVANSLRITVSVGTNAEIMGLAPGSDPRWTVLFNTTGTNNTFQLKNTGGTMTQLTGLNPCATINLVVKGTVTGGPSTITGTVGYIVGTNPLIGNLPNASQGNSSTANDNSTTSLIVTAGIIFPVDLVNFKGTLVTNNRVDLEWITASEYNVDRFEVERSANGVDFTSIGTVDARNMASTYGLQDLQPIQGRNFYRLKMIDNDNKVKYSNIVLINIKGKAGMVVFPSPSADGNVNVSMEGRGERTIVLNDFAGRQLRKWDNYQNNTLRIENLPSGSYLITVTEIQTGTRFVERFVVNK
jgi:hypothetical protein